MSELPLSCRLALWATSAYAGKVSLERALVAAAADLDRMTGAEAVRDWGELGERVVVVSLPRAGAVASVPRGNPTLVGAAAEAGELVCSPALGAALVPTLAPYGPPGDQGWAASFTAYDCDPIPIHRLEMLSVREAERTLQDEIAQVAAVLADLGPVWGEAARDAADAALGAPRWGLPDGLPARGVQLMTLAATVGRIADLGLGAGDPSLVSVHAVRRHSALQRLQRAADEALETATTVCALAVAGYLPADRLP
ncbi:hypothetical protein [Arsenicicoccus dermatophilus]|uniref:hypothetical protein n=1 Tax=Arsenicicoccus dermatophilus TaxID=1076331 RepID=UPI001F4C6E3C|nr:hypothetical protein [Arsenicicoccus dermatophilus]MCH8612536.1 hypothetical protein [Arsenicicoccus dermatophilus]